MELTSLVYAGTLGRAEASFFLISGATTCNHTDPDNTLVLLAYGTLYASLYDNGSPLSFK